MDISSIKPAERIIEILHPGTGEKLGITVSVISLNDERLNQVRRRIQNKRIDLEKRGKTFKADDIEENEFELFVATMTGWSWEGDNTFNGEKPAFNERNVKAVLKELPWFKDQVREAIGDEKAFFIG